MTTEGNSMHARLAVNPISYWFMPDGTIDRSTANLAVAMTELSGIGYHFVKADVPSDMSADQYLDWLGGFGMKPAITLFSASFADPSTHAETAEKARAFAAVQASLGMRHTMISTMDGMDAPRMRTPAVGFGHDDEVFDRVIDGIRLACEAMQSEGVTAALHSHIGGAIETEAEIRTVLESIDADLLKFGPDTGHMAWGGVDVVQIVSDYADRLVAVHLKDIFLSKAEQGKKDGKPYFDMNKRGELWAEPGIGELDMSAIIAAFPETFTGDFMIEVDVPSFESRRESHQVSYDWARTALPIWG